jgi:hypothetical protein
MKRRSPRFVLIVLLGLIPGSLWAQLGLQNNAAGAPGAMSSVDEMNERMVRPGAHKTLVGRVYSSRDTVVPGAAVEITNNAGAALKYIVTDKDGDFQAQYDLFDEELGRHFVASVKVTKKGYLVAHKIALMDVANNNVNFAINLRKGEEQDPNQLSQSELINQLLPRLTKLGPADGMDPKAVKDYARGVQEFNDGKHLDKAVLDLANVTVRSPSCLKCRTFLAMAELKWDDWDDARRELGESVNAIIKDKKVGTPEPLVAFGVLVSWQHDPAKASAYFLDALTYAPKDPLALQELGRAQCEQSNWFSGSQSLKKAIDAGAGREAKLLLAEALLRVGTPQEASDELNSYMDGRPFKSMPARGQKIWAYNQKRFQNDEEPVDYLHHPPTKDLKDFEPLTDQSQMPVILAALGKNVADFFTNFPNVCSIEKVGQQRLDGDGKIIFTQESKYRYLALIPIHPWGPSIDEYRADSVGKETGQAALSEDTMLTDGFVSAPLLFHPTYQSGSNFLMVGRQKVKGRNTYVIAYAQDPAKSVLSGTFRRGIDSLPTYKQGFVWVDAETCQIVRLISDLLTPLPEARLDKQSTDITFGEVHFKNLNQGFWLPEDVTVTLNWNDRTYRNNHAYSDFLLSDVKSTQRIAKPKDADKPVEEEGDNNPKHASSTKNPPLSPDAGVAKP